MGTPEVEDRECLDAGNPDKGPCKGEVQFHPSIAGTRTMIPRCEKHYEALLKWNEEYSQVMPDSPIAPSWFDPTAIGEHWDEDY